jgi:Reverse transcriptase (RNA-dependent DNA polymerase)
MDNPHFYTILTTSSFPSSWKISKIMPIAQSKTLHVLPIIIISPQTCNEGTNHGLRVTTSNCLLNPLHSGFRTAHSSSAALLNVTDDFHKACERFPMTVLLIFDFSKAFYSVIHDILCSKLSRNFPFHSTAVALIKSYLSDRHQCVCVGDEISSFALILRGVIQGSILGPVFLLLFINDLLEVIMFSKAHLYADDAQIYVSGNLFDVARVSDKMNADVSNMWHWSQLNSICFNPQKSQAIIIHTK